MRSKIFVVNPIRESQQAAANFDEDTLLAKRGDSIVMSPSGGKHKDVKRGGDDMGEITGIDTMIHDVETGGVHTQASPSGKLGKYAAEHDEFEEEDDDDDDGVLMHGGGPLVIGVAKEEMDWGDDEDEL
jgi:hypothetical protein